MLSRLRLSNGVRFESFDWQIRVLPDLAFFDWALLGELEEPPPRLRVKTADSWLGICSRGSVLPLAPPSPNAPSISFRRPSLEVRLWKGKEKILWFLSWNFDFEGGLKKLPISQPKSPLISYEGHWPPLHIVIMMNIQWGCGLKNEAMPP